MTDVLSHPAWTVAATLLALLAIVVSIVLFRRGRTKKILEYAISETPIVSVHSDASDAIAITYNGQPVTGVHLVSFQLRNAGNIPIVESDFDAPISLQLGEGAVPLSVDVEKVEPPGLHPTVHAQGSQVVLEPLLLNPGDRCSLTTLVRDFTGPAQVEAHIAGINRLTPAGTTSTEWTFRVLGGKRVPEPFAYATVALLITTATFAVIGRLFFPSKENTSVVMRDRSSLCGEILRIEGDRILVKLADGGRLRTVPVSRTAAIRDNDC